LLSEFKKGFSGFAGGRVAADINDAIDIGFIEGQLPLNLFGWDSCKNLVSSVVIIIGRIQAPSRDASTTIKWNQIKAAMDSGAVIDHPKIFVGALKFLMECLDLANVDAANARCVWGLCYFCVSFLISLKPACV
jgi:hypothetical protein